MKLSSMKLMKAWHLSYLIAPCTFQNICGNPLDTLIFWHLIIPLKSNLRASHASCVTMQCVLVINFVWFHRVFDVTKSPKCGVYLLNMYFRVVRVVFHITFWLRVQPGIILKFCPIGFPRGYIELSNNTIVVKRSWCNKGPFST